MALLKTIASITNPVLDPLFKFMLQLPPFWAIASISLIITLITTLLYKKLTDQELMKTLKGDMKAIQKEIKELGYAHPKTKELQKKTMELSARQMRESFKPMLWTMLPILILFGWFSSHLAYYPLMPNQEFTTTLEFSSYYDKNITLVAPEGIQILGENTKPMEKIIKSGFFGDKTIGKAEWKMNGDKGAYLLEYQVSGKSFFKEVLITEEKKYSEPIEIISDRQTGLRTISLSNQPIKVFGMSWFWAYIIFSLVFNTILRKILKIH